MPDEVKDAKYLLEDQSNIWTPGFILFIIIIGIIIGVCIFELIKWLINRNKKELVHENVNKPADE
jgi:hypothetical protein